jgi:hypothetical protein
MLILAAPTFAKPEAGRGHAVRRGLKDADHLAPGEVLLDLGNIDFHLLPHRGKGHEHDQLVMFAHAIAPKGDIMDLDRDALAGRE